MGDISGVMPRAKLTSLVPDPDFWVDFESRRGGVRHLKDSSALLPQCWLYPPSCCSPLARAIPCLTGWLGCSRSVHHLEKLWHGGDDCTVTLETADLVCGILLLKVFYRSHFQEKKTLPGTQEQTRFALKPPTPLSKSWAGNSSLHV